MFRIRKVFDPLSPGNRETIEQVRTILAAQFPTARQVDLQKIPDQLLDPLRYRYRSLLLVAENSRGKVRGFAVALHFTDINILYFFKVDFYFFFFYQFRYFLRHFLRVS